MRINVIEYLEEGLKIHPLKTAVIDGDKTMDFISLSIQAKALAYYLIQQNQDINKPIAVFLPKSLESIIANLAITYSSNIYMNLDVKNPDTRIKNILQKIQPHIIVTNKEYVERIKVLCPGATLIINIDDKVTSNNIDERLIFQRLETLIDTDPYCIINTSGSTGTPKGVVLNHKSFIDFIEWSVTTLNITDDEIIGSLSPFYFDIYSFELCLLMVKSATIVILNEQLATFPAKLIEALINKKSAIYFGSLP